MIISRCSRGDRQGCDSPECAAAANNPFLLATENSDALDRGSESDSYPLAKTLTFVSPFKARNPTF